MRGVIREAYLHFFLHNAATYSPFLRIISICLHYERIFSILPKEPYAGPISVYTYQYIHTLYLSIYSFISTYLSTLFSSSLSSVFLYFYSPTHWKIKYTYSPLKQFILHSYKKRNKALEAEKRGKVAHPREPPLVRHKGRRKRVTHYRQIENETGIY
ncbi:hypothetical protein NEAUS05_2450 [Nematocida ausubeli]|nr:hypothetical protein NEAUS07_0565 [Nematocida ausubeli]KAI5151260.1 hypothetical protein NEAUS05_2450 [Nematocida ausubeli]